LRYRSQHGNSFGLAGFTTLGFVLELFIMEEQLLACREDKIRSAVDTSQDLVLEFHWELLPSTRFPGTHLALAGHAQLSR
jgi:hypothetical protein